MKTPFLITILLLLINIVSFSQKPRKIFTALQEKNITEAIVEFQKIDASKNYDVEELTLFELSKCLFMIDSSYQDYNPIESIKNFNKTVQNPLFSQKTDNTLKEVNEFLSKYETSIIQIENNIHQKIVFQAKKINTIEAYSRALEVTNNIHRLELETLKEEASYKVAKSEMSITGLKSFISNYSNSKHITEVQFLLEKLLLETAQKKQSIEDLNAFIKEYNSSVLIPKAIDFRDSIVLLRTPKEYESILNFINTYPTSKFNAELKLSLPDLLYNESIKLNTVQALQKFATLFPEDSRLDSIEIMLLNLKFKVIKLENFYTLHKHPDDVFCENGPFNISLCDGNYCKNGFIDSTGRVIIPCIYENAEPFSEGLSCVTNLDGKSFFIDESGEIKIDLKKYTSSNSFKGGYAKIFDEISGKSGFINKNGDIVVPIIYDDLSLFDNGIAAVRINNNYGFIDTTGKVLIPLVFEGIDIDCDNQEVLELTLSSKSKPKLFTEGLLKVCLKNKWGYININNEIIIPIIYDEIGPFREGLALVKIKDKYGFINKSGKIVIPIIYDYLESFSSSFAVVKLMGKFGFIDIVGKIAIPIIYDTVESFRDKLAKVVLKNKYGFIDINGNYLLSTIYDYTESIEGNFALVKMNDKYGYVNKNGKITTQIKFDYLTNFSEDIAIAKQNDNYGLIEKNNGKIVIPFDYDEMFILTNGYILANTINIPNSSFLLKQNW